VTANQNSAWNALEGRYRPALIAYFFNRGVSLSDAEDLVQEVFVRVMRTDLSAVRDVQAFVFHVAGNLLRDRYRRSRTRVDFLVELETLGGRDVEALDPFRRLAGQEQLRLVDRSLSELPSKTRSIFMRARIEGISVADIAVEEGISVRAVHKHVAKAMAHLLSKIELGVLH